MISAAAWRGREESTSATSAIAPPERSQPSRAARLTVSAGSTRRARRSSSRLPRTSAASSSRAPATATSAIAASAAVRSTSSWSTRTRGMPFSARREHEREADQLAAGLDRDLGFRLEPIGLAAQPRRRRGAQLLERQLVGRGGGQPPRREHDRNRGAGLLGRQLGDPPAAPRPRAARSSIRECRSRIGIPRSLRDFFAVVRRGPPTVAERDRPPSMGPVRRRCGLSATPRSRRPCGPGGRSRPPRRCGSGSPPRREERRSSRRRRHRYARA